METGNPFHLIELLVKHRVPFVIIGGHAVTYQGYVRATEDTDIVFKRSGQSERSLLAALQEVNASWISDKIDLQNLPDLQSQRSAIGTPACPTRPG